MRLGYTVRNLTEAQLSMMAKGFALPAMVAAGGPEAVKRFFTNRKVGFNRLIDNVNVSAGRLDDINTLNYQFASGTDRLRSIEMSKKELAKAVADRIGDLEKDIFKLRLTPGVGPLTAEDEIRTLRGVLSDLESVTLYHGSADAAFQLNEAKVLATSASPAIAGRYSEGFTIHSTENYLETPTGRPGKITQVSESIQDARKTLQQAQSNLTKAEQELNRVGKTQWDVNLLQQTIDEQKAIIKRAGARERSSERRAATLDEASDNLLTDMIAAKNAGKEVEIRVPKGWRKVESLDFTQIRLAEEGVLEVTPELFRRSVFRVKGEMNKPVPVRVYGEALYLTKWSDIPLDLRESAFGGSINNYKQWTKDKGWSSNNDPVVKYRLLKIYQFLNLKWIHLSNAALLELLPVKQPV